MICLFIKYWSLSVVSLYWVVAYITLFTAILRITKMFNICFYYKNNVNMYYTVQWKFWLSFFWKFWLIYWKSWRIYYIYDNWYLGTINTGNLLCVHLLKLHINAHLLLNFTKLFLEVEKTLINTYKYPLTM